MVPVATPGPVRPIHPLHAVLLAFPFPLFLGALVSDIAYWRSHEIQWSNFAQWLNAGGLLVGAFALLWALVHAVRSRRFASRRPLWYVLTLLAAWIVGLVNALAHSQDAWAIMPEALWWSGLSTLLALIASLLGYAGVQTVEDY
ncbi:hypothetical protein A6J80_23800 (plasmid) [Paracoccus yeei]|uniref:DUF2231 domain-containing protein n=1 Tax=Paracoccus yeei TaxID=147645 RepID=A0A2P1BUP2_9RHOB|nr:DUF2231 domain-containing protein [Paracoccus yeei]AVI58431.1 hypothetical protein A6J80_23800 [Paracoccus yeei]MBY0138387.1 hypothetical protein [Paracoccus yeei]QEU06759.1 hypothetical protein FOB51_01420 [Paracoccus yeei]